MRKSLVLGLAAVGGGALVAPVLRRRRAAMQAVAPELRSPALLLPVNLNRFLLTLTDLVPLPSAKPDPRVVLRVRQTDDGIPVRVVDPVGRIRPTGALVWIHGGGFVLGSAAQDDATAARLATELGIVVVNVDYRLAPRHPFPAAVEDCYSALRWLAANAGELGIDPDRIAVAGASAGGGLAACLAQLAHDRAEVAIVFQALIYPMLDDRTVLRADHAGTGDFTWTPASNTLGWTSYLGHPPRDEAPAPYAAGARRQDLSGLPPAWIGVGDLDLFHAEDLEYARRLRAAGVDCELVEIPGMYHGADGFFPAAPQSVQLRESMAAALRSALAPATGR